MPESDWPNWNSLWADMMLFARDNPTCSFFNEDEVSRRAIGFTAYSMEGHLLKRWTLVLTYDVRKSLPTGIDTIDGRRALLVGLKKAFSSTRASSAARSFWDKLK